MAQLYISGNLAADPEFYPARSGKKARARFTIMENIPSRVEDGEDIKNSYSVTAFDDFAENIAESCTRGMRVGFLCSIEQYVEEGLEKDGKETSRRITSWVARDGGPSLRWASAEVTKNPKDDKQGSRRATRHDDEDDEEAPKAPSRRRSAAKDADAEEAPKASSRRRPAPKDEDDDDGW